MQDSTNTLNQIEICKPIEGYEGLYEVSNIGNIKSLPRKIKAYRSFYVSNEKLIVGKATNKGYSVVGLIKDGIGKTYLVHRLVASAFIQNVAQKPFVNHIDGNPSNNRIDNLEWCTQKENIHHAIKLGLFKRSKTSKHKGGSHFRARAILSISPTGDETQYSSVAEAVRETGVSLSCVSRCLNGHTKQSKGYIFQYPDSSLKNKRIIHITKQL